MSAKMEIDQIKLQSINELLNLEFLIPSYQRGYRWKRTQVVDLLDDIFEFIQQKESRNRLVGNFYCLQPIIVKKSNGNKYKVIDGQQRLLTIYIILYFLEKKRFSIEFETREKSKIFLENISDEINDENIDFYHMSKAFNNIKRWFEEKEKKEATIKDEFFINLGKYTKVIWYELEDNQDEIEVFTRINSGKIPLTNAELIKALFLNSKNFDTEEKNLKQIEIAKEWDEIEFTLQNNEFWYFLTKKKEYPTRIELLFEIFSNEPLNDEFSTSISKDSIEIEFNDVGVNLVQNWVDGAYGDTSISNYGLLIKSDADKMISYYAREDYYLFPTLKLMVNLLDNWAAQMCNWVIA